MAGSGFQQDSNQLTPTAYRVSINTNTNFATTGTAGGGVNPYDWDSSNYTNATAMSAAQALLLAQGNVRWNNIVQQLSTVSDCRILDVVITGGGSPAGTDATSANTAVAFTVAFDRASVIVGNWNAWLKSQGSTANGTFTNADGSTGTAYNSLNSTSTAMNTTALAVQDMIATALVAGGSSAGYSRNYRVYSPSLAGDSQAKVTVLQPCTPAQAYTGVGTATLIDTIGLVGVPL
jgi:hypothetical protein